MIWIIVIVLIFVAAGVACKKILNGFDTIEAPVEVVEEKEEEIEEVPFVSVALLEREAKEAEKRAKREAELVQAEIDIDFLRGQIASYEGMYRNTKLAYDKAVASCNYDENRLQASNSAVSEKECKTHQIERDRLHKQLLKTETTIHGLEKRLAKAEFIVSRG